METQYRNVIDTLGLLWWIKMHCPSAHLIKLGTMGEYGTPPCDIPEGQIPDMCISGNDALCKMAGLQFPRSAGSFYHLSKVHDSHNIEFACRNWNLCSTDIMQGPVFGVKTADMDDIDQITRFDYDELFGTVINRFCAQAISNHPLTIYGAGRQERGYIPIQESIECMTLAIENPPKPGEYRVLNQFARTYTINELAETVQIAATHHDLDVVIAHYENPRKELESHYYNPANKKLKDLGYKPTSDIIADVYNLIGDILPYAENVNKDVIMPFTRWDIRHRISKII
jgi:UDP-sulfoquinovose synthase